MSDLSDLKGIISSVSFCVIGGSSFNLAIAGTSGSSIVFNSNNPSIIPVPSTTTIPTSGSFTIGATAATVSTNTLVTLTATISPPPGTPEEVRVPAQVSVVINVTTE